MSLYFSDCLNDPCVFEDRYLPTYRGSNFTRSCIDYFFAGYFLFDKINSGSTEFLNASWTDHALLRITIDFGLSATGKGIWCDNPHLAQIPSYVQKINHIIQGYIDKKFKDSPLSSQVKWDMLKRLVRRLTQNYC